MPFETIENPEYADVTAGNGDYERWFLKWSGCADSNRGPPVPHTGALPTAPHPDTQ